MVPPRIHPFGNGPAETTRQAGRWRVIAPWVLGAAAILLTLWGVSAGIERMADRQELGAAKPGQAGLPAMTNAPASIDVKVLDDNGAEYPVGTPLPRKLSLMIRDAGGQEYSMPFDRVGVWAVEAPDGIYTIPETQKDLGNWSWKMTGEGVEKSGEKHEWVVTIRGGDKPVMLGITLY